MIYILINYLCILFLGIAPGRVTLQSMDHKLVLFENVQRVMSKELHFGTNDLRIPGLYRVLDKIVSKIQVCTAYLIQYRITYFFRMQQGIQQGTKGNQSSNWMWN